MWSGAASVAPRFFTFYGSAQEPCVSALSVRTFPVMAHTVSLVAYTDTLPTMQPHQSRAARRIGLALLLFCATIPLSTCDRATGAPDVGGLVEELARLRIPRTQAPRLSITSEYQSCRYRRPAEGTLLETVCPETPLEVLTSSRLSRITERVGHGVRTGSDPEVLHAAALIPLLWPNSTGNSVHSSISLLQSAARLAERPAPVLSDLAAAYLIRAELTQDARNLLAAMDAAVQALEFEPGQVAARFNLALALQSYGLTDRAHDEWREYLMMDSTSGWADEARRRRRELITVPASLASRSPVGPVVMAKWAHLNPQDARLAGWDGILREWGSAVLDGNSRLAAERLDSAGTLGEALERRGGDATLAEAVRAIRAHANDPDATRSLARAHRSYGEGRAAFLGLEYEVAAARFHEAVAARPPSASLHLWARMFHAAAVAYDTGDWTGAEHTFRRLALETDATRYPGLAGAVRWSLATSLLRGGKYEMALSASRESAVFFRRAGEIEHVGGAGYLTAQAEFGLGAMVAAYGTMHQALTELRPYRRSVWLCNLLSATARTAEADGLIRAAVLLQDERVAVAERTGHPAYLAEALLGRALVLTTAGDLTRAGADVEAGERRVHRLRGHARDWLEADLRLARAGVLVQTDPARAVAALDTTVTVGRTSTSLRLLQALVGRAGARLALGDAPGAKADLQNATAVLVERRRTVARAQLQASLVDAARGVFDRVALLELQEGDTAGALAYLEMGRASFGGGEQEPASRRWRVPPGRVALEYALIADTLLIWTVADTTVRLTRATVDRRELVRTIEHVRSLLERRSSAPSVLPDLARLYDQLVRPVRGQLGKHGAELVLIADGEIAGLPFAALYDSARQRYLTQDHPLRLTSSLSDASRASAAEPLRAPRALLVSDPAFDARVHRTLPRLPDARAEADSVATIYPGAVVLADSAARQSTLREALRRADVVHFAGHAVFDDGRPEQSYLVLASEPGTRDPGRLAAAEMAEMDMRHVRLMVLSSCQTLRSGSGRSGGFAGFAGAALGAGARGVVGGLWQVSDELTRPLMTAFHRAYRESGDAPGALQAAQLEMLRSSNPAHRSPAAWAGFRYAGH